MGGIGKALGPLLRRVLAELGPREMTLRAAKLPQVRAALKKAGVGAKIEGVEFTFGKRVVTQKAKAGHRARQAKGKRGSAGYVSSRKFKAPLKEQSKKYGDGIDVSISGRKKPLFISMEELTATNPEFARHVTRIGVRGGGAPGAPGLSGAGLPHLREGIASTTQLPTGLSAGERILKFAGRHPVGSAVGAYFAYDIVGKTAISGASRSLTGEDPFNPERSYSYLVAKQRRLRSIQAERQQQMNELQQLMSQNMARLAIANPKLYNQVMAGRRIPEGAVVIGGQAREDLMEQLAYSMSTGGLQQPGQDPLAAFAQ